MTPVTAVVRQTQKLNSEIQNYSKWSKKSETCVRNVCDWRCHENEKGLDVTINQKVISLGTVFFVIYDRKTTQNRTT